MHTRTHGRHTMVPETSQTTRFSARFFYNTFLYLLTNLFIDVTFFVLASFLQAGNGNQRNNQPSSSFLL